LPKAINAKFGIFEKNNFRMVSTNRLIKSIALLIILIITSCGSKNKISSEAQLLRIPYISKVDQSSRNYFVYLPKGYDKKQDKKLMRSRGNRPDLSGQVSEH